MGAKSDPHDGKKILARTRSRSHSERSLPAFITEVWAVSGRALALTHRKLMPQAYDYSPKIIISCALGLSENNENAILYLANVVTWRSNSTTRLHATKPTCLPMRSVSIALVSPLVDASAREAQSMPGVVVRSLGEV